MDAGTIEAQKMRGRIVRLYALAITSTTTEQWLRFMHQAHELERASGIHINEDDREVQRLVTAYNESARQGAL